MAARPEDDPESIVTRFNDRINSRDLDGLARWMTEDHAFIDSAGMRVDGKDRCVAAWRGFFAAYPDYRNEFASTVTSGDVVAVSGRSVCSEPALDGAALWTARVRDGLVCEWRVYEDTPETRARVGL
ncbi:MAG TPA: nuclear transport factor 2 family protein [Candidatus Dormibacteraeota bacterium]|nr:nuclear transport factor 2 family protein [Candidatus Dormibacteraeota bacterium]